MSNKEEIVPVFKEEPYQKKLSTYSGIKRQLLKDYRKERKGILDTLERSESNFNTDQLINLIVNEMLLTTEELQANSLMLEAEGELLDSTSVLIKRADLMRLVTDIVTRKKEIAQRSGEVDLNSPVFCIFQKLCFENMVKAMEKLKLDSELTNLILIEWQERMKNWGKELKRILKEEEE